jgi:hypothetical protein
VVLTQIAAKQHDAAALARYVEATAKADAAAGRPTGAAAIAAGIAARPAAD